MYVLRCGLDHRQKFRRSAFHREGENQEGFGYQYEAQHVCECLENGLTESNIMTHADTLLLMQTLDEIRNKAGIKYSVD